ncbi:DUF535 family protein [Aquabacterium sp.]|uniref:DUF535 family protein n=1 Tax=Aquabacterium sp. TaxID=1872578 RepID=UPI00198BEA3A|nr:DUF535 family protein [Aquabacterium sp.]MBC7702048.1 DUF535 family protein [Aquabacterium sp.]
MPTAFILPRTSDHALAQLVPDKAMTNPLSGILGLVKKEIDVKRGLGIGGTCLRLLSVVWHAGQHREVVRAISGSHTKGLLNTYSRVVYRYTLPYLSMKFDRLQRQQMLVGHCDFVNRALHASFFQRVLSDAMPIWQREFEGRGFSISVGGPCLHREGDLTLVFKMDGCPLYRMAFSVVKAPLLNVDAGSSSHVLYVGQVQGYADRFAQMRQATRLCRDVAPADLLMAGMAGLAGALGITMVAGVGVEDSLSYPSLVELNTTTSYGDFWKKFQGMRAQGGHYLLALPLAEKPISLIKANHRGRTLAKRELKRSISEEAESVMRPLVL